MRATDGNNYNDQSGVWANLIGLNSGLRLDVICKSTPVEQAYRPYPSDVKENGNTGLLIPFLHEAIYKKTIQLFMKNYTGTSIVIRTQRNQALRLDESNHVSIIITIFRLI